MTGYVNEKLTGFSKMVGPFFLTPGALNHPVISVTTIDSDDNSSKKDADVLKKDEFKFSNNTDNQNKEKLNDNSKVYRCPICPKCYAWKYNLNRHLKYECGTQKRFRCYICSKKFHYNQNCVEHMKRIHKIFLKDHANNIKMVLNCN